MTFKKGEYVLYAHHDDRSKHRRLVGRITERLDDRSVAVSWYNQRFPVMGWDEDVLESASVVDVLAAVSVVDLLGDVSKPPEEVRKLGRWGVVPVDRFKGCEPKAKKKKKKAKRRGKRTGTPVKLTGTQLVTLRFVLAHRMWEHPDDHDTRAVLEHLPSPDIAAPASHFVSTCTVRVPAGLIDRFSAALRMAAAVPHTPPGCSGALNRRAAKLENMGGVDLLGTLA